MDAEEIGDVLALGAAAGKVAIDVRGQIEAAKAAGSDGGKRVTFAEAEAIVERELRTLKGPVMELVKDLVD